MEAFIIETKRGYVEDLPRHFASINFPIKFTRDKSKAFQFLFKVAAIRSIKRHKLIHFCPEIQKITVDI